MNILDIFAKHLNEFLEACFDLCVIIFQKIIKYETMLALTAGVSKYRNIFPAVESTQALILMNT